MNSIEAEMHYRLNDMVLIELSYLSMIIDNLDDISNLPARFDKSIVNKIDISYKKEAVNAYENLKKQISPLYKKWMKIFIEANKDGEDYVYQEQKEIFDKIIDIYKEKTQYILSKINLTYDDFKKMITSPA